MLLVQHIVVFPGMFVDASLEDALGAYAEVETGWNLGLMHIRQDLRAV